MPYHVFGARSGAAAVISAWTFLAMDRSGSCILAMAASSSVLPSAFAASALSSRTRSRAAAFSSGLNPLDAAGFAVVFAAVFAVAILRAPVRSVDENDLESIAKYRRGGVPRDLPFRSLLLSIDIGVLLSRAR